MPDVAIDSNDATINGVNFTQQSSDPTAPAASHWLLYFKAGGLYARDENGNVIGPFGTDVVSSIQVKEVDGNPTLSTAQIVVPNGSLTEGQNGEAVLSFSGLTVREIDLTPSGSPTTLEFPNGTISDQGAGVYRYTPAESGASALRVIPVICANLWESVVGSWALTWTTAVSNQGYVKAASPANGDKVQWPTVVPPGTYTVRWEATKELAAGIVDIHIGSVLAGQVDLYAGSPVARATGTLTDVVVSATQNLVSVTVNGKNASATGYNAKMASIQLEQTA